MGAIGIACRDVEKSIRFYEHFGMDFTAYGEGHYEATTQTGLRIMLDSFALMKRIDPEWTEPKNSGITLCFAKDTPMAVDHAYDTIVKAGFLSEKAPWDAFWGQRYASVRDLDGNRIDIFAPLS